MAKKRKPDAPRKPPPKKPVKTPPPTDPTPDRTAGEAKRERQAVISREASASVREAGPLPPVVNPKRKESCRRNLRRFFETYFPERFNLAWSADHLTAIAKMQACILDGGQLAYAMPRSSGKTALAEAGAVFALGYGHRRFVALVGASEDAAKEMLLSIKTEFETNDVLNEDFPEICHLIRQLDGINNRANGQTLNGERTRIVWTDTRAVLPTVPGSPSSGGRLRVAGITGRIRGMKATLATGENVRPDLAIVDDPQTDESAVSPAQNNKREAILNGAILGLAGPRTKIACFVPCTIIAPGDMADRILDRQRHPVWQGEKSRMVIDWPTNRDLWDRYADLRKNAQRHGDTEAREAVEFYRANRAAMDAGARVSWPERFYPGELSGIQHAMNLRCDRGTAAFQAEFQNDPEAVTLAGQVADLDADAIAKKVNRCGWGVVPPNCTRLTAFIDVGESVLYYAVCGWAEDFGGSVVAYGTCPKQNRSYFASADARPSLADQFPRHDVTARIYAGLKATVDAVVSPAYPRQGGGELRVGVCMIDTGYKPDTVYAFCRESPLSPLLMPGRGYGITAGRTPMSQWQHKVGEKAGWFWRKSPVTGSGRGTHVIYDTNHWKTFVAERWLAPPGSVGCLNLFGESAAPHQLFADHMVSEFRVRTYGNGREVDEWQPKPGRPDNHWLDCVVGCAVGASYLGCTWSAAAAAGEAVTPPKPRPKLDLKALRAEHVAKKGRR